MRKLSKILCLLLACVMVAGALPLTASAAEGEVYQGYCGEDLVWELDGGTGVLTITGTGPMNDFTSVRKPWYDYKNDIKKIVIGSGVTTIGAGAFSSCSNLLTVEMADTVTSIGVEAFRNCAKMRVWDFSDSITTIGREAFYGCEGMVLTELPSSLVTIGKNAFTQCKSIGPSLEFPASVTTIGENAFERCTWLKNVTLHEGLIEIGGFAFYKSGLEKVVIPSTVENLGYDAFYECASLRFVDIKGTTSLGGGCFHACKALEKVNLPDNLITAKGDGTFDECESLTYLYFPASVTEIGGLWYADDTDSLTTVCIANPDCVIRSNFGKAGKLTIYGVPGSTAEECAKKYGYGFKPLGTEPPAPADPVFGPGPVGTFTDVMSDDWFGLPVDWAVHKGVTNGVSATSFAPNNTCQQCEILTFLHRAMNEPDGGRDNPFRNSAIRGNQYYYKAMIWAAKEGLVTDVYMDPYSPCTRADVVLYLWRLEGQPAASTATAFTDVPADAPYAQAVAWAVSKGITDGTSPTTFSPNTTCTRGQIVTFLYRALGK